MKYPPRPSCQLHLYFWREIRTKNVIEYPLILFLKEGKTSNPKPELRNEIHTNANHDINECGFHLDFVRQLVTSKLNMHVIARTSERKCQTYQLFCSGS